jgi:oxygen-independent coproporphyrinogen-3 oxidase
LESWQRSLELALGLQPEHVSLYALTLEHGTPLGRWAERGLLSEPDPDIAADMYEWAMQRLERAGFAQYEISNWAQTRAGELLTCRHNLQYWRNLPYLGLGAGAHGYAGGYRTAAVLSPAAYIQRCLSPSVPAEDSAWVFPHTPATQSALPIDQPTEIGETMMTGLRLVSEGVSADQFFNRFGVRLEEYFRQQIDGLASQGLLEWAGAGHERLRLTRRGRLLGNRVFAEFI